MVCHFVGILFYKFYKIFKDIFSLNKQCCKCKRRNCGSFLKQKLANKQQIVVNAWSLAWMTSKCNSLHFKLLKTFIFFYAQAGVFAWSRLEIALINDTANIKCRGDRKLLLKHQINVTNFTRQLFFFFILTNCFFTLTSF